MRSNLLKCLALLLVALSAHADVGTMAQRSVAAHSQYRFGGMVAWRVENDVTGWLIPAPMANPGMWVMFRMRDRKPVPELVPWAGEFVGKYLISAIQALRMSESPELRRTVELVMSETLVSQDADGYLGPFTKEQRLLSNWDLWGHYHIMLAMLMWHEQDGDEAALTCARRMGDLMCKIYLNTDRRPWQAGSEEMNLSAIHGLGWLYRVTNEQRYLDLMRVFEEDWKRSGDYFQQGLAGVPFYKTPKPRWESLHAIQGLVELYRITGNEDYRTAFTNLWQSIRAYDRHNTGGFSTGEQAIGNPYTPGAIETCCTTAWMALSVDMLLLSGAPEAADELELSFFNSVLGSQHPSGRWFTYDTPMDGKREASAHSIVFQSRAGTPELNCCSVNAPRGLGMLSDWAVTLGPESALNINYLAPMRATVPVLDGNVATITVEGDYPAGGEVTITVEQSHAAETEVQIRVPGWADTAQYTLDGEKSEASGGHRIGFSLRAAKSPKTISLSIPMRLRTWIGDGAQLGKASIYRGPLLLAFDQRDNRYDVADLTPLDGKKLDATETSGTLSDFFGLQVAYALETADGQRVVLRDFATAGAPGTEYASWLPVTNAPPPDFTVETPAEGARLPVGANKFSWRGEQRPEGWSYVLEIAGDVGFEKILHTGEATRRTWQNVRAELPTGTPLYWRVRSKNAFAETISDVVVFQVDAALKNDFIDQPAAYEYREDGLIVGDPLDGNAKPEYGLVDLVRGATPTGDRHGKAVGAVAFDGTGLVRYHTPGIPGDAFSVSLWFRLDTPRPMLTQVFSAWSRGGDDPIRICLVDGKVHARIEGNGGANTRGVPVEAGQWTHVAAVKNGANLRFYVNGAPIDSVPAPATLATVSKDVAVGGNPHHTGDEYFAGAVDDLMLTARALSEAEVKALAGQ